MYVCVREKREQEREERASERERERTLVMYSSTSCCRGAGSATGSITRKGVKRIAAHFASMIYKV